MGEFEEKELQVEDAGYKSDNIAYSGLQQLQNKQTDQNQNGFLEIESGSNNKNKSEWNRNPEKGYQQDDSTDKTFSNIS